METTNESIINWELHHKIMAKKRGIDVCIGISIDQITPEYFTIPILSEESLEYLKEKEENESEFDPMFCKESIRAEWTRRYPVFAWRAGWLYQQLLKLMCFKVISGLSESFVVVDSDTIFLRDVPFVPGKYYFCKTKEYHPPYLPPIRALLGVVETIGFSCVTHHSIFNSRFLQAMIGEIEARHRLPSVEAILRHLDFSEPSCFSEWDLYANYMILRHPKVTRRRQLRWADIKEQPSSVQLAAYAKKYDFVSYPVCIASPLRS